MARRPRLVLSGMPQHVIHRGNNRQQTFYCDRDYRLYLQCLHDASLRYGCLLHHYVLMTNHVHLLMTPLAEDALACTMREGGRRYVQAINYKYERSGTLWDGRYKANLVDAQEYFFTCCRYIELNPMRAGMVGHPRDYRWSSYACYAFGQSDPYVSPHAEYLALGATDLERQQAYRCLFRDALDDQKLNEIRANVNRGWPLGNDAFKDALEASLRRCARPPKRGRPFKAGSNVALTPITRG